jgi:hypothetical protein
MITGIFKIRIRGLRFLQNYFYNEPGPVV